MYKAVTNALVHTLSRNALSRSEAHFNSAFMKSGPRTAAHQLTQVMKLARCYLQSLDAIS